MITGKMKNEKTEPYYQSKDDDSYTKKYRDLIHV